MLTVVLDEGSAGREVIITATKLKPRRQSATKLIAETQDWPNQLRVVALDLPTSWIMANPDDAFTARMFEALNAMMLDMLAAIARKDYDDRRRRQMQGIAKARSEGKYRGRPEDKKRNAAIVNMLKRGMTWNSIIQAASGSGKKLSRATLSKLAKRMRDVA